VRLSRISLITRKVGLANAQYGRQMGYRIGGYLFRRRVNIAKLVISANAFMVSRLNDMSGRLLALRFAISSNAGWRHEPVVAGDAGALFIGVLGAELMMSVSGCGRRRQKWNGVDDGS